MTVTGLRRLSLRKMCWVRPSVSVAEPGKSVSCTTADPIPSACGSSFACSLGSHCRRSEALHWMACFHACFPDGKNWSLPGPGKRVTCYGCGHC